MKQFKQIRGKGPFLKMSELSVGYLQLFLLSWFYIADMCSGLLLNIMEEK